MRSQLDNYYKTKYNYRCYWHYWRVDGQGFAPSENA